MDISNQSLKTPIQGVRILKINNKKKKINKKKHIKRNEMKVK